MPITNRNKNINKEIFEKLPWPKDMFFEDDPIEAAREREYIRLIKPNNYKLSLIGNAAEMCAADYGSTNHVKR